MTDDRDRVSIHVRSTFPVRLAQVAIVLLFGAGGSFFIAGNDDDKLRFCEQRSGEYEESIIEWERWGNEYSSYLPEVRRMEAQGDVPTRYLSMGMMR